MDNISSSLTTEDHLQPSDGKIKPGDRRMAELLKWLPWLSLVMASVPLPIVFLVLFFGSAATDSAAVYLLLFFLSLGLGLVVGVTLAIILLLYRKRWHRNLRDRLATDGVTADEVPWFLVELSSEERKIWRQMQNTNPLLADAFCETLAARLTATRIGARARAEVLRLERQVNRTGGLRGVDTSQLMEELLADRQRVDALRKEAATRLEAAKARLQAIEAAANRSLTQSETELMLKRLVSSQQQFPLALEMAQIEQNIIRSMDQVAPTVSEPSDSSSTPPLTL
jgi:hypothetical protein